MVLLKKYVKTSMEGDRYDSTNHQLDKSWHHLGDGFLSMCMEDCFIVVTEVGHLPTVGIAVSQARDSGLCKSGESVLNASINVFTPLFWLLKSCGRILQALAAFTPPHW